MTKFAGMAKRGGREWLYFYLIWPKAGVKFNSLRNIPSVEVVKLEKGKHNGGQMDILCKRF